MPNTPSVVKDAAPELWRNHIVSTAKNPRLMTAEELSRLPKSLPGLSDRFYELDQGVLIVREPGAYYPGRVSTWIGMRLLEYVQRHALGQVVGADVGFVLGRKPDTVMSPDVAFVSTSRGPTGDAALKFFEGAPDLAIEVMSPSDRKPAVQRKAHRFLAAGARLVWVLDPQDRTATVYRKDAIPYTLHESELLDGVDVVPGFQIRIAECFPE